MNKEKDTLKEIEKEIERLTHEPFDDYTDYSHCDLVEAKLEGFKLACKQKDEEFKEKIVKLIMWVEGHKDSYIDKRDLKRKLKQFFEKIEGEKRE